LNLDVVNGVIPIITPLLEKELNSLDPMSSSYRNDPGFKAIGNILDNLRPGAITDSRVDDVSIDVLPDGSKVFHDSSEDSANSLIPAMTSLLERTNHPMVETPAHPNRAPTNSRRIVQVPVPVSSSTGIVRTRDPLAAFQHASGLGGLGFPVVLNRPDPIDALAGQARFGSLFPHD
jgi:hypothetical protein